MLSERIPVLVPSVVTSTHYFLQIFQPTKRPFYLYFRLGYCWPLCAFINYIHLLTYTYLFAIKTVAPPGFCNRGGSDVCVYSSIAKYLSCDTKKFHDNESTHILHNFWTSTHRGVASPLPPLWRRHCIRSSMHTERCGMGGRTVYSRRRRYSPRVITEASQRPRLTGHVTANSDRGARENMVRMMFDPAVCRRLICRTAEHCIHTNTQRHCHATSAARISHAFLRPAVHCK